MAIKVFYVEHDKMFKEPNENILINDNYARLKIQMI